MKKNQLIILAGVAALALVAAFLIKQGSSPSSSATTGVGQKLFSSFPINDISEIVVTSASGSVAVKRGEEGWVVMERAGYPANFEAISQGLRTLWEMTTAQSVNAGPAQFPRLALVKPTDAKPDSSTATGQYVVFRDAEGKELGWLLIGKEISGAQSQQPMMFNFGPTGRYVVASAAPERAWIVNDSLSQWTAEPTDWLDKTFIAINGIKSVEVKEKDNVRWKAERADRNAEMELVAGETKKEFDPNKVRPIGSVFSFGNFSDVIGRDVPVETTGLDAPVVASITTFDGFTYTVRIGKANDKDQRHVTVSTEAILPQQREPAADEKPEDKKRLDEEFAANLKTMKEKLDKEKRLEGWVYLVPQSSVETLLKSLEDFVKEPATETEESTDQPPAKSGANRKK